MIQIPRLYGREAIEEIFKGSKTRLNILSRLLEPQVEVETGDKNYDSFVSLEKLLHKINSLDPFLL